MIGTVAVYTRLPGARTFILERMDLDSATAHEVWLNLTLDARYRRTSGEVVRVNVAGVAPTRIPSKGLDEFRSTQTDAVLDHPEVIRLAGLLEDLVALDATASPRAEVDAGEDELLALGVLRRITRERRDLFAHRISKYELFAGKPATHEVHASVR